jgi:hypothetical protein
MWHQRRLPALLQRLPTAPPPRGLPTQYIGGDCQLVVICGRNSKLVQKLQSK